MKIKRVLENLSRMGVIGSINFILERYFGKKGWGQAKYSCQGNECAVFNAYFRCLNVLGHGKDSIVFKVVDEKTKNLYVLKLLSEYGVNFFKRTKKIYDNEICSNHLYKINISEDNRFYYYPYDELEFGKTDYQSLIKFLIQLCELEVELLNVGYVYWDFGNSFPNYMVSPEGVLKVIDYGGNSFLSVGNDNNNLGSTWKRNLKKTNNEFIQCQLMFISSNLDLVKASHLTTSYHRNIHYLLLKKRFSGQRQEQRPQHKKSWMEKFIRILANESK